MFSSVTWMQCCCMRHRLGLIPDMLGEPWIQVHICETVILLKNNVNPIANQKISLSGKKGYL